MEKSRFINEVGHISEEYTAIGWKNRKLLSVNISTTKRCCGKVEDFPCLYTRETFSNYPLAKPHCVNNVTLSRRSRDTTWPSDWFNSATFVKLVFNKILLQTFSNRSEIVEYVYVAKQTEDKWVWLKVIFWRGGGGIIRECCSCIQVLPFKKNNDVETEEQYRLVIRYRLSLCSFPD